MASSAAAPFAVGGDDLSHLRQSHASWVAFDLTSRRPHLDRAATSAAEARSSGVAARKALGDLTKGLKRAVKTAESAEDASVNALARQCKSTVKAYQGEIDSLTRRCKSAETSFASLYQGIVECGSDPAAALGEAALMLEGRDRQVENLLTAMEELNDEIQRIGGERDALRDERDGLEKELTVREKELDEATRGGGGGGGKGESDGGLSGGGGALSLVEREEVIRLRGEVAEYEVEFRGLKNQDITIRKLEAKIDELEENREEEIQKELKKAQEELAESEGRRAAEALEREAVAVRRVETLELELRAERAGREASASRLLEADEGMGEQEAAWDAQRQILVSDSERLREELHGASRERDGFRLKLEALSASSEGGEGDAAAAGVGEGGSGGKTPGSAPPSGGIKFDTFLPERRAYEAEISEITVSANAFREELRVKDEITSVERRSMNTTIDALQSERATLAKQVSALEVRAASAPSREEVDKMRHELRVLKRLEYNAVDLGDDDHPERTPGGVSGIGKDVGKDDDLESILVAKLRKAETDLVRDRRERTEGAKEREELQEELENARKRLAAAEDLIASLENDLQVAVATPASVATASAPALGQSVPFGTSNSPDPGALQQILDPSAPQTPKAPSAPSTPASSRSSSERADDHSVATIVMAQRDRLRARCDALEAERDGFKRELQAQVQAGESFKTDNTKLYEKVRYLQTYNAGGASSSIAVAKGGAYSRRGSGMDPDLDLEALEQRYESSVDPFRQFNRAERLRKLKEMSPPERVVFIVARTFLGSKEMRTALFFYIMAMHLLVFATTYHWSHAAGCSSLHDHADLAHFHGGVPLTETPSNVLVLANAAATAVGDV